MIPQECQFYQDEYLAALPKQCMLLNQTNNNRDSFYEDKTTGHTPYTY